MITRCSFAWMVAMLVCVAGCGSLVGAECRSPLQRCGRVCVDLASDRANCGACGNACLGIAVCVSGTCRVPFDAGPDASTDAAIDAARRTDAGDASIDASIDAAPPDADTGGPTDAGPFDASDLDAGPQCGLGELLCGASCVDPNDPAHCGSCTTTCGATEVCSAGHCTPTCAPLTDCGTFCADLTNDPDHCGSCTMSCGAGICIAGACQSALAAHVVVIGHDFEQGRITMSQILANAVLLPGRASVRVLEWQGAATALSITGTTAAIAEGAAGRGYVVTIATSDSSVPVLLDTADTFLVFAQAGATNDRLMGLGAMWSTALAQFLARGGVIVVLEAPSVTNDGTYQVLSAAGLFDATARAEIVHPVLSTVTGRAGDPVLVGVPLSYRGETHTCFFTTSDPDAIVASTSGPVVFDRTVTPH